MQVPEESTSQGMSNPRLHRTKVLTPTLSLIQMQENGGRRVPHVQGPKSSGTVHSASKRNPVDQGSTFPRESEISNSTAMPISSATENNYRALRRKYLLLEEESFALGKELTDVEDDVKTLQDEKLALLDQLVVLEGLVDPS